MLFTQRARWVLVVGFLAANLSAVRATRSAEAVDPLDWPQWRGPEQNGITRETGLADRWDLKEGGQNVLWQSAELGGISTPIVMRGKLYTIVRAAPGTPREQEMVACADAATGKKLWENRFNIFLSDVPDTRVGWSSCVGDAQTGRVYALGVCGYFQCLDGETGKTIWSRSLSEEFGLLSTYGGRTNFPVVFEDMVLVSAVMTGWGDLAIPAHRFLVLDKATGEVLWLNGTRLRPEDTTYSTPILITLAGQAAMVFGSGDGGVHAMQPRTGNAIWMYQLSRRGLNLTPLVEKERVYIGQSEENPEDNTMGSLAALDGRLSGDITKTGELWRKKEVMVGKSTPVLVDGRLYAADDSGGLFVFNAATGEQIGRKVKLAGAMMRASLLYGDGKIYAFTTSAWHVLQPTADGVKKVAQGRLENGEECYGSPIVSHGRLYLPTTLRLCCIGLPGQQPSITDRPNQAPELAAELDPKPHHVQIVPQEVLLAPGGKQQFRVRLFNARGQFLRESEATFSAEGPGEVDPHGVFVADSAPAHTATIVTAKIGGLSGTARVRVVSSLPWKFDFNNGEVPITWIGARYRHVVRELDGERVMVKVTTIPKGTRSQAWMGQIDLSDYTIQADVRGTIKNGKMPDIGLIAQRYTFDMMGASQQLQIRSWTSMLSRFSKSEPFAWKPDQWYTMKFRAAVEGSKAVLRGKAWVRGEPEPKDWLVEATDELGNFHGSPGLFGNANDAELFYDNIQVTPN